ncbi:hypothetical protein ACFSTC_38900 [Nonomuraea ferruginea]
MHSDYGACTLRGRHAYAWLGRLAPALTGLAHPGRAHVEPLRRQAGHGREPRGLSSPNTGSWWMTGRRAHTD